MAFIRPLYSRNQVDKAGDILTDPTLHNKASIAWAESVLKNWRGAHAYPINTIQATLRKKASLEDPSAIIAQRLKRAPSIIAKLKRFPGMKLARMQDIGGVRAVLRSSEQVLWLEEAYRRSWIEPELISSKDYIHQPKDDGYRSIHLVFRYASQHTKEYDNLSIELQLRSRLQHFWATAVETMSTFLGQALKSGHGDDSWRQFFTKVSAAMAIIEGMPPVPGFEGASRTEVFRQAARAERELKVLEKLRGFAIAARNVSAERGNGAYHLIVLDSTSRAVSVRPFRTQHLDDANDAYAQVEKRTAAGEPIEAVLVSVGSVAKLKQAYPNYFLDTKEFARQLISIIEEASID